MRFPSILFLLGRLYCIVGISMLIPAALSFFLMEHLTSSAFIVSAAIAFGLGFSLSIVFKTGKDQNITTRDGFLLVTLAWITISLLGALPYHFSGALPSFIDSFFEASSGFTTTGATVMVNIESQSHGVLLWRSMSQWIGGLGIIVMAVAILPQLSVGGMQLMKNEMPGPTFEQLKPRIKQTALSLWKIYVLFSVILFILFWLAGMNWFESLCHMLTTISSGGFSTRNASMGAFDFRIQGIAVFFMILAGINFVLHYAWLHGNFKKLLKDVELRFYLIFLFAGISLIVTELVLRSNFQLNEALKLAIFQAVSISTSSGFSSSDYELWPYFSKGIIFLFMFVGGCAGSTSGGFKQLRLKLLLMKSKTTLVKQIFPKAITRVKIGNNPVSEDVLDGIRNLFLVSMVIASILTLTLLAFDIEFVTATSAAVACLSNIGPGLGQVGPTATYAWFPDAVKIILSLCMFIGRLEFFTILVLFLPMTWRR